MKNIKQIIGIILIGITMCGCQSNNNTVSSEISVNDSKQEATVLDDGEVYIDNDAMHSLVIYSDHISLRVFMPTHAVYLFKTETTDYTYSAALIGPNGYNCLYNEDGYIYESVTNVIVYDFR
jgi:hypothetical protein